MDTNKENQGANNINQQSLTLIDKYEEDYRNALGCIDSNVKELIKNGQEMKGLMLLSENISKILEIHDSLNSIYSILYTYQDVLKKFESERLKQVGYKLVPLYEQLKDVPEADPEFLDKYVVDELKKVGFKKKHWILKTRILTETEYLLDTLRILVEPEFIPLEREEEETEEMPSRYIPASVKIAVWRRDGGKCVECGSKEKLEYDHIIPLSKGGSNTERNIQLLCEKCNRKKEVAFGRRENG